MQDGGTVSHVKESSGEIRGRLSSLSFMVITIMSEKMVMEMFRDVLMESFW